MPPHTSQEISDNERDAIALLERDGYTRRWDSWAFEIGLGDEPPAPVVADGYAIRGFVPGQDERARVRRDPDPRSASGRSITRCRSMTGRRPRSATPVFAPELLGLAVRGDEVVGAVLMIEDGSGS